jgi:hypothetical protein
MNKKKIIIAFVLLAILLTTLTGCGAGPTEAQQAADLCMRGNNAACDYHAALLQMEKATADLAAAKVPYEESRKAPTPAQ